jgi:hypothetical protein
MSPATVDITHSQEIDMRTDSSKANRRLRRGSFADGEATPELYQSHIGTFAEGEADPDTYSGEAEIRTFAEGQARPDEYAREDHEGTFAETPEPS